MSKSALSASILIAVAAPLSIGQVQSITLRVDGVPCPFCVTNIQKQVQRVPGADRTTPVWSDLDKGLIRFAWIRDKPFSPRGVTDAMKDSGFTLRQLRIEARGNVRSSETPVPEQLLIVNAQTGGLVRVIPDERLDRRTSWDALMPHATSTNKQAFEAIVHGVIEQSCDGHSWRVRMTSWSPVHFGARIEARIDQLACENCSTRTMQALQTMDGVIHAEADFEADRVLVWTTSDKPDLAALSDRIADLGFEVTRIGIVPLDNDATRVEAP